MSVKLQGRYKGKRKRQAAPAIVWIECPGCGWKGQQGPLEEAEIEYVLHLNNAHHGVLECAFCADSVSRGLRMLPNFETLAAHVKHFHPEAAPKEEGHLPPHAFK